MNLVSTKANCDQVNKIDALRILADETIAGLKLAARFLSEGGAAHAVMRSWLRGYTNFHLSSSRYKLHEIFQNRQLHSNLQRRFTLVLSAWSICIQIMMRRIFFHSLAIYQSLINVQTAAARDCEPLLSEKPCREWCTQVESIDIIKQFGVQLKYTVNMNYSQFGFSSC